MLVNKNNSICDIKFETIAYVSNSPDNSIINLFQFELNILLTVITPEFISDNFLANHSVLILDPRVKPFDITSFYHKIRSIRIDQIVSLVVSGDAVSSNLLSLANLGLDYFYLESQPLQDMLDAISHCVYKRDNEKFCNDLFKAHSSTICEKLEWLTYKDSLRNMGQDLYGRNLIKNLRYSLTQGGGFGILLSLVEMCKEFSSKNDSHYIIPKNMMDMLFSNSEFSQKCFDSMDLIINIMSDLLVKEKMNANKLLVNFQKHAECIDEFIKTKNISVGFPICNNKFENVFLDINEKCFQMVLMEILINAAKYSNNGTSIDVYVNHFNDYFCIFVKNDADDIAQNMPENFTDQLASPFFRYHPPYEITVPGEKFILGLGLTAVNYILTKHNCIFSVSKVKDHTRKRVKTCILTQIHIPILQS